MLIHEQTNRPAERKAVILLVVISLLTLFAIVALSFLLYANAEANASKLFREAEANDIGAVGQDAEKMLTYFLRQFIYDVPDDNTGVFSALRGYSLARTMYGWNYGNPNLIAYNGTGRLHTTGTPMNPFGLDDYLLPNYTVYGALQNGAIALADGFSRDPERFSPYTVPVPVQPPLPRGIYTGGANAPYTYPDFNSMFLAAVKSDGTVLMPSFFRPYTPFGPAFTGPNTPNLNWSDTANPGWQALKYMVLRPRTGENPNFPLPEDGGGDVKNLPASWSKGTLIPGTGVGAIPAQYWNNDSFWMDLGAPVMTTKNGKKYKPLFAPLIMDLDGRINLNVAGNVRLNASSTTLPHLHASNQGWGPWEVDLSQVLNNNPAAAQPEWTNVFIGDPSLTYPGRYGLQGYPGGGFAQAAGDGVTPHFYGQVDYDGVNETAGYGYSSQINLPAAGAFSSFPTYTAGYGNNVQPATPPTFPPIPPLTTDYASNPYEGYLHPLLYNYFQPSQNGTSSNLAFPPSNMEALLRFGDVNPTGATSDLLRLLPTNLTGTTQHPLTLAANPNATSLIRNMVTTHSFDVDSPGISPWAIPPGSAGANYVVSTVPPALPGPPSGSPAGFPSLATRTSPQLNNGEFNGMDWRAISAALGKINLNRKLTPYQTYSGGTWTTSPAQVNQATIDRMQFAADIFIRLITVTGAYDLFNNGPTAPLPVSSQQQFDALRWLAQLSANIVDFIDSDDIMTPFPWAYVNFPTTPTSPNPAYQNYQNIPQIMAAIQQFQTAAGTMDQNALGWVFGTELPRVVVNQAYAEYVVSAAPTATDANFHLQINVWAELHNPFNTDIQQGIQADGNNAGPGAADLTPYQLLLANATSTAPTNPTPINTSYLRQGGNMSNPVGAVPSASLYTTDGNPNSGTNGCQVPLAGNSIAPSSGIQTSGFFVVGATPGASGPGIPMPMGGSLTSAQMSYKITVPGTLGQTKPQPPNFPASPTILLQRVANPLLLTAFPNANPLPGQPIDWTKPINPLVTVDFMEGGNPGASSGAPNPVISWQVADATNDPNNKPYGRSEPYAGYALAVQQMTATTGTSFYTANNPPATPAFHWPVHLDRQLVSPMELLQVSAFRPHELTQQFLFPGTLPGAPNYQHRAAWFDEDVNPPGSASHFLYRLFEFLETGSRMSGMAPGGRIPGKVNINTIFDQEILQALCAAQAPPPAGPASQPNYFDQNTVLNIFNQLMAIRSPGLAMGGDGQIHPVVNSGPPAMGLDQPFLSLATGLTGAMSDAQNPAGISINNSLMRSINGTFGQPPLFQVDSAGTGPTQGHPYLQDQLISKIFNNLTTRSNVFALWLTVGFFEVTNTSTRPVQLGAEIGKSEGRQVRHRMFAIIDRSSLATETNNPTGISPPPVVLNGTNYGPPNPSPAGPPPTLPPALLTAWTAINGPSFSLPGAVGNPGNLATGIPAATLGGLYDGMPWGIQAYQPAGVGPAVMGTNLLIDMGASQELVNVLGIDQPPVPPGVPPLPPRVFLYGTTTPGTPISLMAHTGPLAVTPVNTISAYQVTITPGMTVTPPIPLSAVSGGFQGVQWSLRGSSQTQPGTVVMVDVGPNKEWAIVQTVSAAGQPPAVVLQSPNPTGFAFPHTPGTLGAFTISYPIPKLGNPGPQPTLNIRQVPWVVRYFSIIN
jgi:hypothetical protein